MKLHIFAASPNCRKVMALINHLGMDVQMNSLQLEDGAHKGPEIMGINPNGSVPVLEDGDYSIWESNAIMQYLADKDAQQNGENPIYPKDIKKRAEVNKWLFWQTFHYGRAVGDLAWENFAKALFNMGDPDPAMVKDAEGRFHQYAAVLEDQLKTRDFITGDQVTLADFAMANTSAYNGMGKVPLDDYPSINAWYARMEDLDAWSKAAPPMPA